MIEEVRPFVYQPTGLFDFEGRELQVLVQLYPGGSPTVSLGLKYGSWGPPEQPLPERPWSSYDDERNEEPPE